MERTLRCFLLLILIACCANGTQAIIAYPRRVKITVNADSFYITLRGDENYKYAVTDDGYTVLPDSLGWYYAYRDEKGEVVRSLFKASSISKRDQATKNFLATTQQSITPSYQSEPNSFRIQKSQSTPLKSKTPVIGERRILIILMQYSDVRFTKSQTDFDNLFNQQNYSSDGAYGSVYDYYNKVSYGQLHLRSDVVGPYTASRNMAYYGANSSRTSGDTNPKALFDEAIRFAIQEVNLSDYDSDGDGYVDNIHIVFAGYGEEAGASANAIWSHEMTFRDENIGGMLIDRYSCSPELRGNSGTGITRIGPPCHEIGHALGAMDYYDVDYQAGGYYEGTGEWDIMASGSWNDEGTRPADFNPYVKAYNFGWVDVQTLEGNTENIVAPSTSRDNIYRIDTPVSGDFFLLDNRQSEGVNSAEPGRGLLIFHIGPQIGRKENNNTINSTYPQQCYVVCASARDAQPRPVASSYGSINSSGCPYPGSSHNTSFSKTTVPGAFCINGVDANFVLTDIDQLSNGCISLKYKKSAEEDDTPPEEPDDDEETYDEIIWSDDFEGVGYPITQNRTVESLLGDGMWKIKSYSEIASEKNPPRLSGNKYMAMENSSSGSIMGDDSRFSSRMISNQIQLQAGDYLLRGYFGGYSTKKTSKDTLFISIQTGQNEDWENLKSLHVIKKKEWEYFSVPINITNNVMLRLAFTGSADEKSTLFIDNISLCKPVTDGVYIVHAVREKPDGYYALSGKYLGNDRSVISVSGIYIVIQNGRGYKTFLSP